MPDNIKIFFDSYGSLIADIAIPIATFILGGIASYFQTARQFKKKVEVVIDPAKKEFRIYNTGNFGLPIKDVGIGQKKSLWFSQVVDKTLSVDADPF